MNHKQYRDLDHSRFGSFMLAHGYKVMLVGAVIGAIIGWFCGASEVGK